MKEKPRTGAAKWKTEDSQTRKLSLVEELALEKLKANPRVTSFESPGDTCAVGNTHEIGAEAAFLKFHPVILDVSIAVSRGFLALAVVIIVIFLRFFVQGYIVGWAQFLSHYPHCLSVTS